MGIKSIIVTDRLYWLGRYSERVFTTLRLFTRSFDALLDADGSYGAFCKSLDIPNIYKDNDDFIESYAFSLDDPNSIISNLHRAYDNAIELRAEIGSASLSYIQLAMYEADKAKKSQAPLLYFQNVADYILAFWGCIDDQIDDENTRNIIKIGKRVERLDIYARMHRDKVSIEREVMRLAGRIDRTDLQYRADSITELKALAAADEMDYPAIISAVERIME